ncbi:TPA: DUF4325 domain-containing protein [Enterobacter hormaechei]|uniref:STAS-like domain-containing protein n=1 Tax=Enterobacter hormaechei TaxID=158836 RepID=UPI00069C14A2|nr:STAS-like domain-containing protein [Enterobacter hormaechei]MDF2787641.1 hypothetical protein [Neobacillus sp.]HDU8877309.1 STAS-like domain-containing protein [Enterobacter hormaechei]
MKSNFLHFNDLDGGAGITRGIFNLLEGYNLNEDVTRSIYVCGTEIIMNVLCHAYPENYKLKSKHALSFYINVGEDYLDIIFQDYGATIPVTVLNKIPSLAASFNSSTVLKMTVSGEIELEGHRGKGLPSLLKEVSGCTISKLTIISGEAFLKVTKDELLIFNENIPKSVGTKIILSIEKPILDEGVKSTLINIKDAIGRYPFGRYKNEGPGSAEELRDDFLIPALNKYDLVNIELDGVMGYGASFLEEVFGGLVRSGFNDGDLIYRINIVTEQKFYISEINGYIEAALNGNR